MCENVTHIFLIKEKKRHTKKKISDRFNETKIGFICMAK